MLKIIKRSVLTVSRALGYDIMPLRDVGERDFAIHLRTLFAAFDIDCVLDVGANTGQYRDFLRERVPYRGPIVSFEPVAHNVRILQERAAGDSRWTIEGYALGSANGSSTLNVSNESQFSSFLEPSRSSGTSYIATLVATDHTETVAVKTLDEVLRPLQERLAFRRPYLKIDTQGYDLEVLRGAASSLPCIPALQTEASVIAVYKGMPSYTDTITFLNQQGFAISGLYPVARDPRLRLLEFDCVMVNEALPQQEHVQQEHVTSDQAGPLTSLPAA